MKETTNPLFFKLFQGNQGQASGGSGDVGAQLNFTIEKRIIMMIISEKFLLIKNSMHLYIERMKSLSMSQFTVLSKSISRGKNGQGTLHRKPTPQGIYQILEWAQEI
jgi:hypothetical protein